MLASAEPISRRERPSFRLEPTRERARNASERQALVSSRAVATHSGSDTVDVDIDYRDLGATVPEPDWVEEAREETSA